MMTKQEVKHRDEVLEMIKQLIAINKAYNNEKTRNDWIDTKVYNARAELIGLINEFEGI